MRFETRVYSTLIKVWQVGYLASLGQARTAEVKRDAIIGKTAFDIRSFFLCIVDVFVCFVFFLHLTSQVRRRPRRTQRLLRRRLTSREWRQNFQMTQKSPGNFKTLFDLSLCGEIFWSIIFAYDCQFKPLSGPRGTMSWKRPSMTQRWSIKDIKKAFISFLSTCMF